MRIAVIAAAVCLSIIGFSRADDARAAMRRPTDIPAQSLGSALKVLAQARDLEVLYFSESVRDVRTGGATGELTTDEALRQLLSGTGLTYRYVSDKAITILPVGGADNSQVSPPPSGGQAPSDKEGKKSSSDQFRVAQVDQGQTSGPSTVDKQDEQAFKKKSVQLEEVIITGSRIPVPAGQGAQPVRVYTREQIDRSGQTTVSEFLNTLPEVSLASLDSTTSGFGDRTTVQLHGLPAGTTLVLLNGHRIEIDNSGTFDLNNIPAAAVERIEVLPVGSSAIYGSDALAGTVNVILKKSFNGFEANARYGNASGTDETDANLGWGWSGSRAAISLIGTYQRKSVLTADHRLSILGAPQNQADACFPGNVYSLNGGNLPGLTAPNAAIPGGISGTPTISDFVPTAGTINRCSTQSGIALLSPVQRQGLLANGHYQLTDSIDLFTETLFSHEEINTPVTGSVSLFSRFGNVLPAGNPYNPFGQDVGLSYNLPGTSGDFDLKQTFVRPLVGIRGPLFGSWNYELTGLFSRDRSSVDDGTGRDFGAIASALASSSPATALNPFTSGAPASPTVLSSFNLPAVLNSFANQVTSFQGFARGSLFSLPAGTVSTVVGGEFDRTKLFLVTPPFQPPTSYYRRSYALFAEARLPILSSADHSEGGERLALALAARDDHSNDFGSKATWQGGLEWRPVEALLIRGSYATAYKAPQLFQVYTAQVSFPLIGQNLHDPSRGGQLLPNGVPQLLGGNPGLAPETGNSHVLGLVYAPDRLRGLTIYLSQFRVDIKDNIFAPSAQDLLSFPNLFPGRVTRGPPSPQDVQQGFLGPVISINDSFANFGGLRVDGVDFDLKYRLQTPFGELAPSLSVTETYRWDSALAPGAPTTSFVSQANLFGVGFAPRWKGTAALGFERGPYAASVTGRYTGRYNDYINPFLAFGVTPVVPTYPHELGNFWLIDANLRWDIGRVLARQTAWLAGTSIEIGGNNLFNKPPQYSYDFTGYDPLEADVLGRFLYARVGVRF